MQIRSLLVSLQQPTLQHLEQVVSEVTLRAGRGETRIVALAHALENCPQLGLGGIAHALRFQTRDYAHSVSKNVERITDTEVRTICSEMLPLLLLQRDGSCHLRLVVDFLTEFGQLSRWVSQSLIQTKVQSWFMALFVPVAALFFVVFGREQFAANVFQPLGLVFLLLAFALYVVGCLCLHYVFTRRKRILFSTSLAQPAGQAALLRAISSSGRCPGECLPALNLALEPRASQRWKRLGRLILFGYTKFSHEPNEIDNFTLGERDFILRFLGAYLKMGARKRFNWVIQSHRALEQVFKSQTMAEASRLTLSLLLVLAIFFLPALFLMLGLSGMNFGPGTLE